MSSDVTRLNKDALARARWAREWTYEDPKGDFVEAVRLIRVQGRDYLSLVEQNESYVRLLEAADAAWKWLGKEYPNVVEAMPPKLYRAVHDARVPYPAKDRVVEEWVDGQLVRSTVREVQNQDTERP